MNFFKNLIAPLAFSLANTGLLAGDTSLELVVVKTRGEYEFSPDTEDSPKSAFFNAQNDARRKAIIEVCGERVISWEILLSHNAVQSYSGVIITNSVGIVRSCREIRRGWTFPHAGDAAADECPTVFFEAEVTVEKSCEKSDPSFTALIEGGKSRYRHNESSVFSIKASQDAYLTIFWLNHDFQADIIFPLNRYDDNRIFADSKTRKISVDFYISSPKASKEAGALFFVLTKKRYPFLRTEETNNLVKNRDRLEKWMASLPLRERFIYALPFVIER